MILPALLCATTLLTNATDVASAVAAFRDGVPYEITGTVTYTMEPQRRLLLADDGSGSAAVIDDRPDKRRTAPCAPGDIIRIRGRVRLYNDSISAPFHEITRIGHVDPPAPRDATVAEIRDGLCDNRFIRVRGTVRESFRDEIDPRYIYFVLSHGNGSVYVTVAANENEAARLRALKSADVSVTGACIPVGVGRRRMLGRTISPANADSISVLQSPTDDPFDVPVLSTAVRMAPDRVLAMGRRRIRGRVLAVRSESRAILSDDEGSVHNLQFSDSKPPACGVRIEAAGFPATDLYRINLSGAIWRPLPDGGPAVSNAAPCDISAARLLTDARGKGRINVALHGRTVRLRGTVIDVPSSSDRNGRMIVKDGKFSVPVEADALSGAFGDVSAGCTVEITGCCAVETESWHSYAEFPHATGASIILRAPEDLRVLARPPWWTPARLLAVIGALFAVLAAILVWNLSLRCLADRRGRALFSEQVARVGSELRVEERTRLAVELHDSISQNLSGISMQIDAAERLLGSDPARTARHLGVASRTLTSCREELRNCIWDLRNQALEEQDMNAAIRRTLQQHLEGTELTVRFNVPRARISDNTAHALMRIVRELAVNAVRHGHATTVRIAGAIEDGHLLFSVADNGCGFDPESRPGIAEGHFGLQGIAERVRRFNGRLTVKSAPGKGTRVAVSLRMPNNGQEDA